MLRVTQVPSQAKEVIRKSQHKSLFFLPGIASYFLGKLLDGFQRQFLGWHVLDDLLNLLELLFRYEGLAELLQVHGRTVVRSNGLNLVACQDVIENFLEFETIEKLGKQPRSHRCLCLPGGTRVESPLGVLRLIQIFTEPPGMIFHVEVE